MKIIANFFNCLAGTRFLILVCVTLAIVSIGDALLQLRVAGEFFNFLVVKEILSYEAIQEFLLRDNQRAYWFIFAIFCGLILSGYGFLKSVRHHETTGKGTGAKKLVYLGLLLIFAAGSVDSTLGYKGSVVLQKAGERNEITLKDGTVKSTLFSIKVEDFLVSGIGEFEGVNLAVTENEKTVTRVLQPWESLHQGLYTMHYYNLEDAKPLITFFAKSLKNLTEGPVMIGVQVGRKVENTREDVSFRVTNINPPKAALLPTGDVSPGFKNEGRSADYILEHEEVTAWLRTFENYPHMLAVNDGKNRFLPVSFGLSISNQSGWDVLAEYREAMAKSETKDEKAVASQLKSLEKYSEILRPVLLEQVKKASSVIDTFQLPYMLQMDQVYPLHQITLMVQYAPGVYLAYLGVFLLIAGLFVSFVFSRRGAHKS
jgi:hypothetical protein